MSQSKIYLILNNIRSAHNVGSIFRTADGAGVSKIYLCGITPQPSTGSNKIAKTALGAEKTVPWEYRKQTWRCLLEIKNQSTQSVECSAEHLPRKCSGQNPRVQIVALEQSPKSINIFKYKPPKNKDIALVVGNEVRGLNKTILSLADKIVEILMFGKKESLNVAVATGIALYKILEFRK